MVKLSEILRKDNRESSELNSVLAEAAKQKEVLSESQDARKIYVHIVERFDVLLENIKANKKVEGNEIVSLAQMILDSLRMDNDLLHNLTSPPDFSSERNNFLPNHSVNVSILAANLANAFDFNRSTQLDLCTSALLHDLGMLIIPEEIIQKTEKLSKKEYDLIKMHPSYGAKFMQNISNLPDMAKDVILHHHERIDGSGYPEGRSADQISKFAQIVGIVEIYEAVSQPRPYRTEMIIPSEAVKIIIQEEASSFEKDVLRAFMNQVTIYPVGSYVQLNTNEIGAVKRTNSNFPLRPIVEVLQDTKRKTLKETKTIDLSRSPILYIEKAVGEDVLSDGQ